MGNARKGLKATRSGLESSSAASEGGGLGHTRHTPLIPVFSSAKPDKNRSVGPTGAGAMPALGVS